MLKICKSKLFILSLCVILFTACGVKVKPKGYKKSNYYKSSYESRYNYRSYNSNSYNTKYNRYQNSRVRVVSNSRYYPQKVVRPASYVYPNDRFNLSYAQRGTMNRAYPSSLPKISRSMAELDRDSANVRPTLVYNYPTRVNRGVKYVDLSAIKYRMINYINNIRVSGNKCAPPAPPLTWSDSLAEAAAAHAGDMATNNFLGHLGSGGVTDVARKPNGQGSNFYERIRHFGYPIQSGELAGEIITYTKFKIVGNEDPYMNFIHAVDNFQRSPKHCAVMMNPRFVDMGISAYRDDEKIYWVIEFGEMRR